MVRHHAGDLARPALLPVLAIPNRLEQVIVNLILNARDAWRNASKPERPPSSASPWLWTATRCCCPSDTGTGFLPTVE
ncbi:MAG: hypothetical protein ACLSHC_14150 [Bilophila wadsworthia]